jgi:hypothetical protein
MFNVTQAPMPNNSKQVQTSNDYAKFKTLIGNRKPNDLHIKRLTSSFKERYLFSPIIVNEKMQIIDGQHRFIAAKELNLPINYLLVEGYGLEEVQILNTNTSNWKKEDYLKAYCDLGVKAYLQMQQFMLDYPDFGVAIAEMILTDKVNGENKLLIIDKVNMRMQGFQNGELNIPDLTKAYETAEKVLMFKPYYDGYNRATFVRTLITLFKNENYVHAEMISKLANNPSALTHCANVTQYKFLLEDIFNFRRREKLNLRY